MTMSKAKAEKLVLARQRTQADLRAFVASRTMDATPVRLPPPVRQRPEPNAQPAALSPGMLLICMVLIALVVTWISAPIAMRM